MQLIADSGSTKTTWALIENGTIRQTILTAGLNPYFHTRESVEKILQTELCPSLAPATVHEIHFYGAGCSTENKNRLLTEAMRSFFREADIRIYHDILGAARALFGKEQGIACILGTGCNSCWYDGSTVTMGVASLGYLFGDEGAGSNIGKRFMGCYLKEKLPTELRKAFDEEYHFTLEDILDALYNRPSPNRFLASFSKFIAPRQDHPFLRELVKSSLQAFFDEQVKKYANYRETTAGFIGSIAFYYREILLETAAENHVRVGTILREPMEGLVKYHFS
ncbi:MAG TPA: ATPase [Bacteroidales bacterium]|nr:ATPase [Bacteroidales bacterium]HPS73787.1 ATPase [Bacteroidales bacterium]